MKRMYPGERGVLTTDTMQFYLEVWDTDGSTTQLKSTDGELYYFLERDLLWKRGVPAADGGFVGTVTGWYPF